MTDAEIIAAAADATAQALFAFANGQTEGTQGAPIESERAREAVVQCAGAFQHFAALVRIGIAENGGSLSYANMDDHHS